MTAEMHGPAGEGGTGLDMTVAHPARVDGYWLGGKDHDPPGRGAAIEVMRRWPQVVAGARANRAFLARVVHFLAAGRGIRHFLGIGTGLPAPAGTHEVAQRVDRACRVCYGDNDQLVLDLSQPVGVLLLAVLLFIPGVGGPSPARGRAGQCGAGQLRGDLAPDRRLRPPLCRPGRRGVPGAGARGGDATEPYGGQCVVRRAAAGGAGGGAGRAVVAGAGGPTPAGGWLVWRGGPGAGGGPVSVPPPGVDRPHLVIRDLTRPATSQARGGQR